MKNVIYYHMRVDQGFHSNVTYSLTFQAVLLGRGEHRPQLKRLWAVITNPAAG